MDYKINHLSTVEKELEISFSAEEVQAQFKQEYSQLSHTVTVKGFRPGKVPLNVLKQFYGKNIKADVEHHFISEGMQDAVLKEKLRLATNPEIFDETELSENAPFHSDVKERGNEIRRFHQVRIKQRGNGVSILAATTAKIHTKGTGQ